MLRATGRSPHRPSGSITPSPPIAWVLAVLLGLGWLIGLPVQAAADGPTTFSNTASIAIPGDQSSTPVPPGPASPYPSNITVSGMAGAVTKVTVTFHNLTHPIANDIDAMVVAPTGENLVVFSDVANTDSFSSADNATLTFDDAAATTVPPLPGGIPSGTYRPTNVGGGDTFPATAPTPSTQTTLAGAFTGIDPNGTWQLWVADDTDGDAGQMAGGWSITITTEEAAAATTTAVTTSDANSLTGQSVTFTATVRAGATPVTAGTVQFSDGGTNLGAPVALNGSGVATLATSALTEGTHLIRATFSGSPGFLTSNGTVTQRVDNPTQVSGDTFCNAGPITGPAAGAATPYPSNIFVTGLSGQITEVTATLRGLSHSAPIDFDVLLSGPTSTQNVFLLSDAGGQSAVSNVTLTFDDDAATNVPSPPVTGTFRPTRVDDGNADPLPAPAPPPSSATALATFDGGDPNGTWSLWVNDDASGDTGSIADGWCLTITAQDPTATDLTAAPNPSRFGQPVTFTATVTTGGTPVDEGTVQFRDGATNLGAPVAVAADGTATLTTSTLTVGTHTITADYGGTADLAESSDTVDQVVDRAASATTVTSSGSPSSVGQSVTFTAAVTSGDQPVTSGSVQFAVDGTDAGAPVPLDGTGQATFTTGALTAGTHTITADFGGTPTIDVSDDEVDQVVERIATQTTLASSVNPSVFGQSVTFTATVTSGGGPVAAGSVQFRDDETALGAPVSVAADGTATLTNSALAVGTHPITAEFIETDSLAASTSDPLNQVVGQASSATAVISDNNPSNFGEDVTFTATVTSGGTPVAGGSVQFSSDGTDLGAPVAVGAGGIATLTTDDLTVGTHTITATFSGTTEVEGSSGTVDQVVDQAPSTTTVVSSLNPSIVGQDVTFTATVTAAVPLPAGGTVQFADGGTPLGDPVPVTPAGVAALTTAGLAAGTHTITATYSGGGDVAGRTGTLTPDQVVNRTDTQTRVTGAPDPSGFGQQVAFTATVTTVGDDPVTTGSVAFSVDGAPVSGPPVELDGAGQAVFEIDSLSVGAHTILAQYAGDASFGASSDTDSHTVELDADAGGPYTVAEGASLTLDGSGSSPGATLGWDLNGDGDFGDAAGFAPTLTWAQLEALGINDGPATHQVAVLATAGTAPGAATETSPTVELTVTNTDPISVLTGGLTATVGVPFTIKVGADDPSSADMAALFTYTVDWGDGSPVLTVVGPADPPVTHTYSDPGHYAATFSATDRDGGTGPGTEVTVVAQNPSLTTSPSPDDDDLTDGGSDGGDLAETGSPVGPGLILLGLALVVGGAGALLAARRRRGLGVPRHRD